MKSASKVIRSAGLAILALVGASAASADDYLLRTDATWRTIKGSVSVGPDWNSSLVYDDSDTAGWTNSFKSQVGDRIWNTSNLSSESPANPRFRHLFDLSGPVTSATAHFYFDDDATVWINGTEVLDDASGGASTFDNLILDPSLFHSGENLIAVWGHNTLGPYNNIEVDISLSVVPEPSSMALMGLGVAMTFSGPALAKRLFKWIRKQ